MCVFVCVDIDIYNDICNRLICCLRKSAFDKLIGRSRGMRRAGRVRHYVIIYQNYFGETSHEITRLILNQRFLLSRSSSIYEIKTTPI